MRNCSAYKKIKEYKMKRTTKVSLAFAGITGIFGLAVWLVWNNEPAMALIAVVVSIAALVLTMWYEKIKEVKNEEIRKNSLTVFKRILLFKLIGTIQIIHWALQSYLSYDVEAMYPTSLKIGHLEVGEFQRQQFNAYKLYYDEIKYFATSEIVPIEIKEDLDMLNLYAEKLINFLPVKKGKINQKIFERYLEDVHKLVKWAIDNEKSDLIVKYGKELNDWIGTMRDLKDLEHEVDE